MSTKQLNLNISKPKTKRGFTLIELLVVISIIGILAAFIVASFTTAQQKARDSKRKADLDAIKKALELAKSDTPGSRYYPTTPLTVASMVTPGYIKNIPVDPQNGGAYLYFVSPLGCTGATCTAYRLEATLENTNDNQAAGPLFTAGSAANCPNSTDGFTQAGANPVGYTAATYVVCQQ